MNQSANSMLRWCSDNTGWVWFGLFLFWITGLSILPDPRPLGAPEWAVDIVRLLVDVSEATARLIATVVLRGTGIAMIGILLAMSLQRFRLIKTAALLAVGTPVIAVGVKLINLGYMPLRNELWIICVCALLGALAGLAIRRSVMATVTLVGSLAILFTWGASTGVSNQLNDLAQATSLHLLENAQDISSGDRGFAQLMERAFAYAEEHSQGAKPIEANQAAILALGVILGDELVAKVGRRSVLPDRVKEIKSLRQRITAHTRQDLSMHFWVSAALTVLSDENRALTVGIVKELKDSTPGGSGFSFVDMGANKAGIRFAALATRDDESARSLQARIRQGVELLTFMPEVRDLPEGITGDQFKKEYGGLGGRKSREILAEIDKRISELEKF